MDETEMVKIPLKEYQKLLRAAEDLKLLQSCSFYDEVDPWVIRCAHSECPARAVVDGKDSHRDCYYNCTKMMMCYDQGTCSTEFGDTYYCDQHAASYLIEIKEEKFSLYICHGCVKRNKEESKRLTLAL